MPYLSLVKHIIDAVINWWPEWKAHFEAKAAEEAARKAAKVGQMLADVPPATNTRSEDE